jgi:hypothetical protein
MSLPKQNKPENAAKAPSSRFKSVRKTPLRPILSSEILDADQSAAASDSESNYVFENESTKIDRSYTWTTPCAIMGVRFESICLENFGESFSSSLLTRFITM